MSQKWENVCILNIFLKSYLFFIYMGGCFASQCVCVLFVCRACGYQKRTSDFLGGGATDGWLFMLNTEPGSSARAVGAVASL